MSLAPQNPDEIRLAVVSDIHYAGPGERQRTGYLLKGIPSRLGRFLLTNYRRFIWLRDPFAHNHLLDAFTERATNYRWTVALGDYCCDCRSIGVADPEAFESASECLAKLRAAHGDRFLAVIGDHELGKKSLGGGLGGLRLRSLDRAVNGLGLKPFWHVTLGHCRLLGVTSTLLALPVFEPETLPEERAAWWQLREQHLAEIRQFFAGLQPAQRVILFCHDPTALPFLWRDETIRGKLGQVDFTLIGHLHTPLVLWQSRLLAGMPIVQFLGTTPRRLTTALNQAKYWRPFRVCLCPALAGIELLKDGGFLALTLAPAGEKPPQLAFHRIRW